MEGERAREVGLETTCLVCILLKLCCLLFLCCFLLFECYDIIYDSGLICFGCFEFADSGAGTDSLKEKEIVRKEMGLEWMLRPGEKRDDRPAMIVDDKFEETPTEEVYFYIES